MTDTKNVRAILNALRPLNVERQLVVLTWFKTTHHDMRAGKYDSLATCPAEHEQEFSCLDTLYETTTSGPWNQDATCFEDCIEILETNSHGICDNCNNYGALRIGGEEEASQCRWGCEQ